MRGPSLEVVGARPSVLRGELVNKSWKEEPVYLECSEGLVTVNSRSSSICVEGSSSIVNSKGARPTELRKELVNRYCKREPACLKCSEGLVTVNSRSSSI